MHTDRCAGSASEAQAPNLPLTVGLFFVAFILLVVVELFAAVIHNGGVFSYTLDDPYIHLALAKKIQTGIYGINSGEFSAPASSILWPLLLAAVPSAIPGWVLLPLLLNFASVLVIGCVFLRVLRVDGSATTPGLLCLGAAIAVALNLAGLVMAGMEHALQVALIVIGIWGLVEIERTGRFPPIATAALILGPLVRYEDLAITLPACAYLVLMGRWQIAVGIVLITGVCLAAFSGFLVAHGLDALPTSVLARADALQLGRLGVFASNLKSNLMEKQAWILLLLTLPIAMRFIRPFNSGQRRLAGLAVTSVALHMVAGRFGWYSRYEIYIFAVVLIVLVALYREELCRVIFARRSAARASWARPLALLALSVMIFHQYANILRTIPLASNNIYLQQMQMARFATDYWKRPVGVNDIGAVALSSNSYVLDFAGLASQEVLHARSVKPREPLWMDRLARSHKVGLAMLYTIGFPDLPPNWIVVAKLHLDVERITAADRTVAFYATDPALAAEIRGELRQFSRTLPRGSSIEFM